MHQQLGHHHTGHGVFTDIEMIQVGKCWKRNASVRVQKKVNPEEKEIEEVRKGRDVVTPRQPLVINSD